MADTLTDDWFTFFYYLFLFFYGCVLISAKDVFWKMVQHNRRIFLANGLIGFILLLGIWIGMEDSLAVHLLEAAGSMLVYEYFIRRINFIRPLFGLKSPVKTKEKTEQEAGVIWPYR